MTNVRIKPALRATFIVLALVSVPVALSVIPEMFGNSGSNGQEMGRLAAPWSETVMLIPAGVLLIGGVFVAVVLIQLAAEYIGRRAADRRSERVHQKQ